TMIKEIIWAKSFASDVEGPDPMNHFRALVLSTEAAAQAKFMMTNLSTDDGLFLHGWKEGTVTDTSITPQDQAVMLWALSELADYTSGSYKWYAAPLSHDQALMMADGLAMAIVDRTKATPRFLLDMPSRDLGVALSAFSAYANYTENTGQRTLVLEELIPALSGELRARMNEQGRLVADGGYSQVATQGAAINGLVFAYMVTGNGVYKEEALRAWDYMETLWDETAGVYASDRGAFRYVYTARDVADVTGAFNALLHGLKLDVEQRFADFFNGAVNRSGLQIAEGPPTGGGQDADSIPDPFHAGGKFGQSPVLATEAVYNVATGEWSVTNPRFTTAYAMAAANQFMWIGTWGGKASVPGHGIPSAPAAVGEPSPAPRVTEFALEGTEWSLTPATITVNKGDTVKIVFTNVGNSPHNVTIDQFGAATATISPGSTETVEFAAEKAGTFAFYCSVPGHRGLGMEGELSVL
ncbi:MAG: cupredoxin domain-containing protein, partial [Dehalococcoidia bacterium]